jgi:hypothetical protein
VKQQAPQPPAAFDHPLVRSYLRELDAALRPLPRDRARELDEQIRAHLEETIPPDADAEAVADALRRLGTPGQLAAQARSLAPPQTPAQRFRSRLGRPGWRGWAVITVVLAVLAAVTTYVLVMLNAAPLEGPGSAGWWYRQDGLHAVNTSADEASQTTVPIRSGQWQGFAFTVTNPSPFTQTILGPGPSAGSPGNALSFKIGVATADPGHGGGDFTKLQYVLPGIIPPHQTRWVRMLWISQVCLSKGSSEGTDAVPLRVRIGLLSRTEVIPLGMGWFLSGPSQPPPSADANDPCNGT